MTTNKQQAKGFTIIEVVLVLAIAALIFLLVFLALPALQRSRRDTQRRQDLSRVLSQVQTYQANNNGGVPTESYAATNGTSGFVGQYMTAGGDSFNDPSTGTVYDIREGTGATAVPDEGVIFYDVSAACNGEQITNSTNDNDVAVRVDMEGSGVYCVDNS